MRVKITLEENSTGGRLPRTFLDQEVNIRHESPTRTVGADGHISVGSHPSEIFWRSGKSGDLQGMTDVKMESARGEILLDGALINTYGPPRDRLDGVQFQVLRHGI